VDIEEGSPIHGDTTELDRRAIEEVLVSVADLFDADVGCSRRVPAHAGAGSGVFGGGSQDLSTCAVYTFTPQYQSTVVTTTPPNTPPAPPLHPIGQQLLTGFVLDLGPINGTVTLADDFDADLVTSPTLPVIDLGAVSISPTHPIAAQLLVGNVDLGLITSYPTLSDDFGATNDSVTGTVALGTVP